MPGYRKPGVYVEESLLPNNVDTSTATSVALFVGAASIGPTTVPVLCSSWSDFVVNFGGFGQIPDDGDPAVMNTSYLPYAVYSYFQSGGKPAYVQRAVGSGEAGDTATRNVVTGPALNATINHIVLASNVVTVTTTAAHGFTIGEFVTVTAVTATAINGVYEITDTPTSVTFTYALVHANITSAADTGTAAVASSVAFTVTARSVGTSGNTLAVTLNVIDPVNKVFNLSVYTNFYAPGDPGVEAERFSTLTMDGSIPGTRAVDTAVNDAFSGSTLVRVSAVDPTLTPGAILTLQGLTGGTDPSLPDGADYPSIAADAVDHIEVPVIVNLVGYTPTPSDPGEYIAPSGVSADSFGNRGDVFVINDGVPNRGSSQSSSAYKSAVTSVLGQFTGDSYVAAYTPWLVIPDPAKAGATITVPPGGAVAGVMSRVDSTIGVFRAPAGLVATITNAIGVDTKFSDTEMGDLNEANINVIRPVSGAGVAIMGARTRKLYAADRYISARRTLIYIKESMKRSTQYALFENNDQRLWSRLIGTAERLLRPLWEEGGLRGANVSEAYYIKCDSTINTPALIQSGEVRMEIGVALEFPAEFIVIRVTQVESASAAVEVSPLALA